MNKTGAELDLTSNTGDLTNYKIQQTHQKIE